MRHFNQNTKPSYNARTTDEFRELIASIMSSDTDVRATVPVNKIKALMIIESDLITKRGVTWTAFKAWNEYHLNENDIIGLCQIAVMAIEFEITLEEAYDQING